MWVERVGGRGEDGHNLPFHRLCPALINNHSTLTFHDLLSAGHGDAAERAWWWEEGGGWWVRVSCLLHQLVDMTRSSATFFHIPALLQPLTFDIINLRRPVRHKLFSGGRLVFQQVRGLVEQVPNRLFGAFIAQDVPLFVNVVVHRVERVQGLRFEVGRVFGSRGGEEGEEGEGGGEAHGYW